MLLFVAGCWDTGRGEKVGSIIKLNKQGIFCKTWEAEIIRGGLNTGSGVMGQAFHFTIEDNKLAEEVEKYLNNQQEVKISYRREGITWCRSDSNDHFLTKIEPLGTVSNPPAQSKEATVVPATTPTAASKDEMVNVMKKQNEILEQNQQLMKQLLDDRKKK
jgi:hypothetical protein